MHEYIYRCIYYMHSWVTNYYTPTPRSGWGYIGLNLSVRLWTNSCPLCIFHNKSRIHLIFIHLIKQLQKVCGVGFFNSKICNFVRCYIWVLIISCRGLFPMDIKSWCLVCIFHNNYWTHLLFVHLIMQLLKPHFVSWLTLIIHDNAIST